MSIKKRLIYLFAVLVVVFALVWVWTEDFVNLANEKVNIEITLFSNISDDYQLFYSSKEEANESTFDANSSYITTLQKTEENEWFSFVIPANTSFVRFDSGYATTEYKIKSIKIRYNDSIVELDIADASKLVYKNHISSTEYTDVRGLVVTTAGEDAYAVWDVKDLVEGIVINERQNTVFIIKIICTIVVLLISVLMFRIRRTIMAQLRDIYSSRKIIRDLSKNDFKNKFSGSYLGVFWAFVQPIVVVTIYWFIFSVGFKSAPIDDCPYLLWLIAGICPWFFYNDAINAGTNSLYDYSYIVKKMSFKISIIPVIKIISCAFVHAFFIGLVVVVFGLHRVLPTFYVLQALYYSFCTFMLALGITYLTSSLSVFFKDLAQIVNILLQFGMWMTPIMYSETMFGDKVLRILKLNPMYYVVNGYRDSFINGIGFWEHGLLTAYFWSVTLVIFGIGMLVYRKLRPHFADVL